MYMIDIMTTLLSDHCYPELLYAINQLFLISQFGLPSNEFLKFMPNILNGIYVRGFRGCPLPSYLISLKKCLCQSGHVLWVIILH